MWEVKKSLGYQNDSDARKPEVTEILHIHFKIDL